VSGGLVEEERHGVPVHCFGTLAAVGVEAFVTDRRGGVSAPPFDTLNLGEHVGDDPVCVLENRRRVARAADVAASALVVIQQVHGGGVVTSDSPANAEGDAIVLARDDQAVAVLVADCVPLVVVAPSTHRLVVVHAGWRGLLAGVIPNALVALGAPAADVRVGIGPAISAAAYQVGPEVATRFASVSGVVSPDVGDRSRLDLVAAALAQLRHAGVGDGHVQRTTDRTDDGGRYFSDRATRPCGRFALVARWRP
jgi:polyphenol oxidase